uniref:Uncharacterized protein n=1 Tax=Rousettus aegyptiacus TaxID=9407 RepID=A0A7J8BRZ5_ROUAE|nr:hypothetical protein HJG63_009648 [Rousettus aegyptiacus]
MIWARSWPPAYWPFYTPTNSPANTWSRHCVGPGQTHEQIHHKRSEGHEASERNEKREAERAERRGPTGASVAIPGLARLWLNPRWGEKPGKVNDSTCKGPEAAPGVLEGQVGQETHVAGGEHVKGRGRR